MRIQASVVVMRLPADEWSVGAIASGEVAYTRRCCGCKALFAKTFRPVVRQDCRAGDGLRGEKFMRLHAGCSSCEPLPRQGKFPWLEIVRERWMLPDDRAARRPEGFLSLPLQNTVMLT